MDRKAFQPAGLTVPPSPYSPVVRAGGLVFVAGQTALDEQGELVGEGDPSAQTEQVLRNLTTALEAAGSGLRDVVRATVYLADMSHYGEMNAVYRTFFPDSPPARATLEVRLVSPDWLVEIDAIAIIPTT